MQGDEFAASSLPLAPYSTPDIFVDVTGAHGLPAAPYHLVSQDYASPSPNSQAPFQSHQPQAPNAPASCPFPAQSPDAPGPVPLSARFTLVSAAYDSPAATPPAAAAAAAVPLQSPAASNMQERPGSQAPGTISPAAENMQATASPAAATALVPYSITAAATHQRMPLMTRFGTEALASHAGPVFVALHSQKGSPAGEPQAVENHESAWLSSTNS